MAKLIVEAMPGAGVTGYSLYVDGALIAMDRRHRGSFVCDGGVSHSLVYAFHGASGGTLGIRLSCGGVEICRIPRATIAATGAPRAAGRRLFQIGRAGPPRRRATPRAASRADPPPHGPTRPISAETGFDRAAAEDEARRKPGPFARSAPGRDSGKNGFEERGR